METTKMTQRGQGFMSWNVERAVSVQTCWSAEPDSSNTNMGVRKLRHKSQDWEEWKTILEEGKVYQEL